MQVMDVAEAARIWCRRSKLGAEVQNKAARIRILAERKAGTLLAGLKRGKTGPKELPATIAGNSDYRAVLKGEKIPERTAQQWQEFRAQLVEDNAFYPVVDEVVAKGQELTPGTLRDGIVTNTPDRPAEPPMSKGDASHLLYEPYQAP